MEENKKVRNAYPEKQELPYIRTSIQVPEVVVYLKELKDVNDEAKKMLYVIFRNESANGKSGINNNYFGIQADGARLGGKYDALVTGTTVKKDAIQLRRFCCFSDFKVGVDYTLDRIIARQMYIGGTTFKYSNINVKTSTDLARVYYKEWVTGNRNAEPSQLALRNFISMYNQISKALASTNA